MAASRKIQQLNMTLCCFPEKKNHALGWKYS